MTNRFERQSGVWGHRTVPDRLISYHLDAPIRLTFHNELLSLSEALVSVVGIAKSVRCLILNGCRIDTKICEVILFSEQFIDFCDALITIYLLLGGVFDWFDWFDWGPLRSMHDHSDISAGVAQYNKTLSHSPVAVADIEDRVKLLLSNLDRIDFEVGKIILLSKLCVDFYQVLISLYLLLISVQDWH